MMKVDDDATTIVDLIPVIYKILSLLGNDLLNSRSIDSISDIVSHVLIKLDECYSLFDELQLIKVLDGLIESHLCVESSDVTCCDGGDVGIKNFLHSSGVEPIKSKIIQYVNIALSQLDESTLLTNKFSILQSNMQKNGGYYSFDFNSIPDFEPIDGYLESLQSKSYSIKTIEKLLSIDVDDLFENHLWLELLPALQFALISNENLEINIAIFALYYRFMQAFKSHAQGLDVISSFLHYLTQQWLGSARKLIPKFIAINQIALFTKMMKIFSENSSFCCEKDADSIIFLMFSLLANGVLTLDGGTTWPSVLDILRRVDGNCKYLNRLCRQCHPISVFSHALSSDLLVTLSNEMIGSLNSNFPESGIASWNLFRAAFLFSLFDSISGNLSMIQFAFRSTKSSLPTINQFNGGRLDLIPVAGTNKRFFIPVGATSIHTITSDPTSASEFDVLLPQVISSLSVKFIPTNDVDAFVSQLTTTITFLLRVPATIFSETGHCTSMNYIVTLVADILNSALTSTLLNFESSLRVLESFVYGMECFVDCLQGLPVQEVFLYAIEIITKALSAAEAFSSRQQIEEHRIAALESVLRLFQTVLRFDNLHDILRAKRSDFDAFTTTLSRITSQSLSLTRSIFSMRPDGSVSGTADISSLSVHLLFVVTLCNSVFLSLATNKTQREFILELLVDCLLFTLDENESMLEPSVLSRAILDIVLVERNHLNLSHRTAELLRNAIKRESKRMDVFEESLAWYGSESASPFLAVFELLCGVCAMGLYDLVIPLWIDAFVDLNVFDSYEILSSGEEILADPKGLEQLSSCGIYPYFLRLLNICCFDIRFAMVVYIRKQSNFAQSVAPQYMVTGLDEMDEGIGWDLTGVFHAINDPKLNLQVGYQERLDFPHALLVHSEQEMDDFRSNVESFRQQNEKYCWKFEVGKYPSIVRKFPFFEANHSLESWRLAVISNMQSHPHVGFDFMANKAFQFLVMKFSTSESISDSSQGMFSVRKEDVLSMNFFALAVFLLSRKDEVLTVKIIDSLKLKAIANLVCCEDPFFLENEVMKCISKSSSETALLQSLGIPLQAAVHFVARNWFFDSLCWEDIVIVTAVTILQGNVEFAVLVVCAILRRAVQTLLQDEVVTITLRAGGFESPLRAMQLKPSALRNLFSDVESLIAEFAG